METRIDAVHGDYRLVRYVTGETRIEHAPSRTCSGWLDARSRRDMLDNPALMAVWALDNDMDEDVEEQAHAS